MILEYKETSIFYNDQGQGKVVVLLHGFLETSFMWKDLVGELKAEYRIITIDLLGHGQTGCWGYIHTMEMMAEAVVFVLRHLKLDKAVFVGHSMGGYVALALADAFPDKIVGLVLMNSTPFPDSTERQANRDRAIKAVKYNPMNFIRLSIGNLFSPDNRLQFAEEIEVIKLMAICLPVQGVVAALEGMKIRKDRSVVFREMRAPKLVLLGKRDSVMDYVSLAAQLTELGIKTVLFSGGHMSYLENKEELTYNLKLFLEK